MMKKQILVLLLTMSISGVSVGMPENPTLIGLSKRLSHLANQANECLPADTKLRLTKPVRNAAQSVLLKYTSNPTLKPLLTMFGKVAGQKTIKVADVVSLLRTDSTLLTKKLNAIFQGKQNGGNPREVVLVLDRFQVAMEKIVQKAIAEKTASRLDTLKMVTLSESTREIRDVLIHRLRGHHHKKYELPGVKTSTMHGLLETLELARQNKYHQPGASLIRDALGKTDAVLREVGTTKTLTGKQIEVVSHLNLLREHLRADVAKEFAKHNSAPTLLMSATALVSEFKQLTMEDTARIGLLSREITLRLLDRVEGPSLVTEQGLRGFMSKVLGRDVVSEMTGIDRLVKGIKEAKGMWKLEGIQPYINTFLRAAGQHARRGR